MTGRTLLSTFVVLLAALVAWTVIVGAQEDPRARGKQLFTDLGCYGCHVIDKYGTPIATNLTHVGSKYNAAELTLWLKDPASQKPTAHMPRIAMGAGDAESLAEYLASLK